MDGHTGQELDILPFGELSEDGKSIVWPDDNSSWSIIGLQDAFDHALQLKVKVGERALQLPLITAPALVMLKIVAVHDRPEVRHKKDGTDIGFVIEHYLEIGNKDRLRTEPHDDIMAEVDGDLELAISTLLGRDIAAISAEAAHAYVLELLDTEAASQSKCYLAKGLQRPHCRGDFNRAREILQSIARGMRWKYGARG